MEISISKWGNQEIEFGLPVSANCSSIEGARVHTEQPLGERGVEAASLSSMVG
jgi:hypothetical protein